MSNEDAAKSLAQITEIKSVARSLLHMNRMILLEQSNKEIDRLRNLPRNQEHGRLIPYGWKVYSQNDEDGIINEIFKRIGTNSKKFLEFGVENGLECNSTYLLMVKGWTGTWLEASTKHVTSINSSFKKQIDSGRLQIVESFIDRDNINDLIVKTNSEDIDLLSIDIDGNDYWVWQKITKANPRVVIVEYNAIMPADVEWSTTYKANHTYDGSLYHSASLKSFETLGNKMGYKLVGCNINGCNAFFVREDLIEDKFAPPYTSENHYEPFRHPYCKVLTGKRATPKQGVDPSVTVKSKTRVSSKKKKK